MLVVRLWNAHGAVDLQVRADVLLFGLLNATLDTPDRLGIFVEHRPIASTERPSQAGQRLAHVVEDTSIAFEPREPSRRIAFPTEQTLEDHARVPLHGILGRRRSPGHGRRVETAEIVLAAADVRRPLRGQLERLEHGFLPQHACRDLIGDGRAANVRALRWLRQGTGQVRGGGADMHASPDAFRRFVIAQPGEHGHVILMGRHGRHRRRQREPRPFRLRRPIGHRDAIGDVEEAQARHRSGGGSRSRRERRHHRIEERQRECDPCAQKDRSPRNCPARNYHAFLHAIVV